MAVRGPSAESFPPQHHPRHNCTEGRGSNISHRQPWKHTPNSQFHFNEACFPAPHPCLTAHRDTRLAIDLLLAKTRTSPCVMDAPLPPWQAMWALQRLLLSENPWDLQPGNPQFELYIKVERRVWMGPAVNSIEVQPALVKGGGWRLPHATTTLVKRRLNTRCCPLPANHGRATVDGAKPPENRTPQLPPCRLQVGRRGSLGRLTDPSATTHY